MINYIIEWIENLDFDVIVFLESVEFVICDLVCFLEYIGIYYKWDRVY